jgi:hypothetical protein
MSYPNHVGKEEVEGNQDDGEYHGVGLGWDEELSDFWVLLKDVFPSGEVGFRSKNVGKVGFGGFLVLIELLDAGFGNSAGYQIVGRLFGF